MAYVLIVPHPSLSRFGQGVHRLYVQNSGYAQQVRDAQRGIEVVTIRAGSEEQIWPETLNAYRSAAQSAGRQGTIGVLVGHGLSGGMVAADLAPPEVLRLTEAEVSQLARANRSRPSARWSMNQQRALDIGRALQAYEPRVDLWTCNVGTGSSAPFLDSLAEVWRVSVRGLTGKLESVQVDAGPIDFFLTRDDEPVRGARWRTTLPADTWWRRSELLEREIALPDSLLLPQKSTKPSTPHEPSTLSGGRASTYRNPPPLGPAPRTPR